MGTGRTQEFRVEFGHRLRKARLENKFTQDELAKMIGMTRGAVQMYEKARRNIDLELMIRFAEALNKSLDYFFSKEASATLEAQQKAAQQKEEATRFYNLNDTLEYSMETAIRQYLKAVKNSDDLPAVLDDIMNYIRNR